jgi:hypothetical protein
VSFEVGLQITRYHFESQTTYHEGVDIHDHIRVSYADIKIPFSVGRDFGYGNIRPFARIGAVLNGYMNKKSERQKELTTNPPLIFTDPAFNFVSHPISAFLDGGVLLQRGKFIGTFKGRFEMAAAPFVENVFKRAEKNISQRSLSAILSVGYKLGKQ